LEDVSDLDKKHEKIGGWADEEDIVIDDLEFDG